GPSGVPSGVPSGGQFILCCLSVSEAACYDDCVSASRIRGIAILQCVQDVLGAVAGEQAGGALVPCVESTDQPGLTDDKLVLGDNDVPTGLGLEDGGTKPLHQILPSAQVQTIFTGDQLARGLHPRSRRPVRHGPLKRNRCHVRTAVLGRDLVELSVFGDKSGMLRFGHAGLLVVGYLADTNHTTHRHWCSSITTHSARAPGAPTGSASVPPWRAEELGNPPRAPPIPGHPIGSGRTPPPRPCRRGRRYDSPRIRQPHPRASSERTSAFLGSGGRRARCARGSRGRDGARRRGNGPGPTCSTGRRPHPGGGSGGAGGAWGPACAGSWS